MTSSSSSTRTNFARSTAAYLVPVVRRRFVTTISLAALVVGAVSLIAPDISAAPPSITVTQPVQVTVVNTPGQPAQVEIVKPVEVQGVVATLDDVLRQPFHKSNGAVASGEFFDMTIDPPPAGKRLIIETVSVSAILASGKASVLLVTPDSASVFLPVSSQGVFPLGELFVGTHSIKLRVDGTDGPSKLIIRLHRTSTAGLAILDAEIAGYVVDL